MFASFFFCVFSFFLFPYVGSATWRSASEAHAHLYIAIYIARGHLLRPMEDTRAGAKAAMDRRHPSSPDVFGMALGIAHKGPRRPARSRHHRFRILLWVSDRAQISMWIFAHLCFPLRSHSRVESDFQSGPRHLQLIHIQNPKRLPHI